MASAEASLARVVVDRNSLDEGPSGSEAADAQSSIVSAQTGLARAQATLDALKAGPAAVDVASAQGEVTAAEESLRQAHADLAEAQSDPGQAIVDAESGVASAEADALSAQHSLSELRAQPTPDQVVQAEADLELARLTYEETVRTSSRATTQAKERAEITWAEAQRTYAEAVQPATPEELAEAEAQVRNTDARLASMRLALVEAQRGPDFPTLEAAVAAAQRKLDLVSLQLQDLLTPPTPGDIALEEQNVAAAASSLRAARARSGGLYEGPTAEELAAAESAIGSSQATLDEAKSRLEAVLQGADASELDQLRRALARAEIGLAQVNSSADAFDVQLMELSLATARRQLDVAEDAVASAELRAPFKGVVTAISLSPGEQASGPVVTLVDTDSVRVVSNIDEADIGVIGGGLAAELVVENLDGAVYQGSIASVAIAGQSDQGLVTFPVFITIANADQRLRGGLTVDITIVTGEATGVLAVPRAAVQSTPRGSIVRVVDASGAPELRMVTVGVEGDDFVEITSGLAENDHVLISTGSGQASPLQQGIPPGGGGPGVGIPIGGGGAGGFRRAAA